MYQKSGAKQRFCFSGCRSVWNQTARIGAPEFLSWWQLTSHALNYNLPYYLEDNTGLSLDFTTTSSHQTKLRTRPTKLDYSNNKSSYAVLPLTRVRSKNTVRTVNVVVFFTHARKFDTANFISCKKNTSQKPASFRIKFCNKEQRLRALCTEYVFL